MKKLLSILLTAALLLSCGVCAWAAEEPAGDHSHVISDIYFITGDQVIDLSGLTMELDVTGDAGTKAGRLHVDQNGETVAEFGVTVLDGGLHVLHMDSSTLGHKDYGVDPVVVLSRMIRSGIDNLTELLQSIDPDGTAQSIVDEIIASVEEAPAAEEAPEPEEPAGNESDAAPGISITVNDKTINLSDISIEGDPTELILSCIGEPETVHMGGTEYDPNGNMFEMPDGEYQVQTFTFDTDTVCQLLDMVYVDGESVGLGDKFREAGVDFLFAGTFYDGDAAHIAQISGSLSGDDFSYSAGGGYNQLITDEGKTTTYSFGTSSGTDPETMSVTGLSFTVSDSTHEGEPFTPASVDADDLIMLSDMEPEEALDELSQSLSTLLVDMLMPVMEDMMGDMDMEGLETPAE